MSASRPAASLAKRARAAAGSFNKSSNVEDAVAERLTLGSKAAAGRARSSWCLTPWGGGCKANDGGLPLGADEVARTICPWSTAGGTVVEGGPIRDESVPVGDGS
ncbi:hypothetical protein WJX82_001477 [Trebouxia sp. C0006]